MSAFLVSYGTCQESVFLQTVDEAESHISNLSCMSIFIAVGNSRCDHVQVAHCLHLKYRNEEREKIINQR